MKTRTLFLLFALLLILPSTSEAQVRSLIRDKLNKAVNAGTKTADKEIDNKIDTAVQKKADNVKENSHENAEVKEEQSNQGEKKTNTQAGGGLNLGGLMGGKVTLKYDDSYSFNSSIYMQMEMYDKKDVTKMDYYIYFNSANENAGFESKMVGKSDEGEVTVATSSVFDGANKIFLMLTNMGTTKMGIISEIPNDSTLKQGKANENKDNTTITKTGNTRVIAGYKCDEYLFTDNETNDHGKMWITNDLKLKADKRTFSKAGLPAHYGNSKIEGITLAMESYNKKNELQMKSETKEINLNISHTITTTGYSLRQMNFNQAQGQNKKK